MAQSALQIEYIDHTGLNTKITLPEDSVITPLTERRKAPRTPVIKSGRVVIEEEDSEFVFECLVIDESRTGAHIDLGTAVNIPPNVRLQIDDGGIYFSRLVWSVGTRVGLEFIGDPIIPEGIARRMQMISKILQTQGLTAAHQELETVNFFGNEVLRQASLEAEASYSRLNAILSFSKLGVLSLSNSKK